MQKKIAGLRIILLLLGCGCVATFNTHTMSASDFDTKLRKLLKKHNVTAATKPEVSTAKAELGRLLFFDKILSGNKNISCATCHLPQAGTSDALPLSIGQGGKGEMAERIPPKDANGKPIFVPRNALDIFNRGEFTVIFWDGRVMMKSGPFFKGFDGRPLPDFLTFWTPAGFILSKGLDNALAAQAMFPPTSDTEMRGGVHENDLGKMDRWEMREMWRGLIERIMSIDEYKRMFFEVFPDVSPEKIAFFHAANAIAAFEIDAFTFTDAPFDLYLNGDDDSLSEAQKRGALLFYGKAKCVRCHSGSLLTDQKFHNRVVPQIGPGKGLPPSGGPDGTWDIGRGFTGRKEDRFCFRTSPLRNVAASGPWMHDGAFTTLEAVVRHELDPVNSAKNYDPSQLPKDFADTYKAYQTEEIITHANRSETASIDLNDQEVNNLIAFLESLTSPQLATLEEIIPEKVPSGLPVRD